MKTNKTILGKILKRKFAILVLIGASAFAAYATLGDGNNVTRPVKKSGNKSLLKNTNVQSGTFNLKSGYTFRGNQVFSSSNNDTYINLNTTLTYSIGHTTLIVPLKKKVLLDKIITNDKLLRNSTRR